MYTKKIILFCSFLFIVALTFPLCFRLIQIVEVWSRCSIPSQPVVIIESDDWGALRGLDWGSSPERWSETSHYDCLETTEDIESFSEMLSRHRDSRGRSAVVTANVVFESIAGNWHTKQIWRKRVPAGIMQSWNKAMKQQVFYPQLHAMREADEKSIVDRDPMVRAGYSPYMVWNGNCFHDLPQKQIGKDVHDGKCFHDLPQERIDKAVLEGQELFEKTFGFKSLSTVAPRYLWSDATDSAFSKAGIRYVQGKRQVQNRKRSFFNPDQVVGERTRNGLVILGPRINFEQAGAWKNGKSVDEFVKNKTSEILRKLDSHHIATISTHRANYVSGHNVSQRKYGLMALDLLLSNLIRYCPELIILTSPELGQFLQSGYFIDVFSGEIVEIPSITFWQFITLKWKALSKTTRVHLLFILIIFVALLVMLLQRLCHRISSRKNMDTHCGYRNS